MTTGTLTTPGLKEWSAAVHALLDGCQTVLLRKGGIGEKRFELSAPVSCCFRPSRTATPNGCGHGLLVPRQDRAQVDDLDRDVVQIGRGLRRPCEPSRPR